MSRRGWLAAGFIAAGAAAMAAGFLASGWWLGGSRMQGEPAPAVALTDLSGQTRTLAQWQGKLLLVNFWATWCAPCVDEIPLLVEAQARYGAKGLQVLGPAFDEPGPARAMAQRLRINYPVSADLAQADAAARALGNHNGMLPYTVLISRDGRVLETVLGGMTREQIDTLVQEHL